MHWLIEHHVDIMNKYSITRSGKSAYEEMHGNNAAERRVEFGERIFYLTSIDRKLDLRWKPERGVYWGHAPNSNEIFVGVKNFVFKKARTAVRVVETPR